MGCCKHFKFSDVYDWIHSIVYFCNMKNVMESRYFPPAYLMDQLKLMQLEEELEVLGKSVENREI